jgi:carbamoyl-phosphate synthase small subunit
MAEAKLLLQDGTLFTGKAFGALGTCSGEIAFNTSMTGYQEIITDPSYCGQVLILNNCYTGNYGTFSKDVESNSVKISGLICKNITAKDSRHIADDTLQNYLANNNIVCIYDIDTRALVAHIRKAGAMNCVINNDGADIDLLKTTLSNTPSMEGLEMGSMVSTKEVYTLGDENASIKIAVMDYGVKNNILQCMVDRGAFVKVFPAKTSMQELQQFNADGFFISNGPGDPSTMNYAVETVKEILKTNKPLFGICLGNQLLGMAVNIPTYKMHSGHRGGNHPVKNLLNGTSEISTQNHGFALDAEAIKNNTNIIVTHQNLNDGTIEGIQLKDKPAFSVQYHPEATPGPHDSRYLFDDFITLIKKHQAN